MTRFSDPASAFLTALGGFMIVLGSFLFVGDASADQSIVSCNGEWCPGQSVGSCLPPNCPVNNGQDTCVPCSCIVFDDFGPDGSFIQYCGCGYSIGASSGS